MIKIFVVALVQKFVVVQNSRFAGSHVASKVSIHPLGQWVPRMQKCPKGVDCDKILAQEENEHVGERPIGITVPTQGRVVPHFSDCCRKAHDIQKTVLSKLMELYRSPIGEISLAGDETSDTNLGTELFEPKIFRHTKSENDTGKLNIDQELLNRIKTDLIWFGAYTPTQEQKAQHPNLMFDLGIIYKIDNESSPASTAQNSDPKPAKVLYEYEQIQIRVVNSTETRKAPNGTSYKFQTYKEQVTTNQVFSSQCDSLKNLSPQPKFHKSLVSNILLNQEEENPLPDNCF